MLRVLFVDNDATGLSSLQDSLTAHNREWDVHVSSTPAMAAFMAERDPFNVVVINVMTPGHQGVDLFTYFNRQFPDTVRVAMMNEDSERVGISDEALAHQTIYMDSTVEFISSAIQRSVELQNRLSNPLLQHLLDRVAELPSPPRVITQLNEALSNPDVTINQITEIVSQDVAIPARILHVVNTAYFALSRTMTNIREAVAYLGVDAVRNLSVAVEMFRGLTDPTSVGSVKQVELLGSHSSSVAQITRQFISHKQDAQDAFISGLLHDVGHLVLASYFITEYVEIQSRVSKGEPLLEVERELLGVTHCDIGAFLLRKWGLPFRMVDVVAFHHEAPRFAETGMDPLHGVYIGEHLLAESANEENTYWEYAGLDSLESDYLSQLGMLDRVNAWRTLHVVTHTNGI